MLSGLSGLDKFFLNRPDHAVDTLSLLVLWSLVVQHIIQQNRRKLGDLYSLFYVVGMSIEKLFGM